MRGQFCYVTDGEHQAHAITLFYRFAGITFQMKIKVIVVSRRYIQTHKYKKSPLFSVIEGEAVGCQCDAKVHLALFTDEPCLPRTVGVLASVPVRFSRWKMANLVETDDILWC